MVLETHMKLLVTEPYFLEKIFFPQNFGKLTKNGPKTGFFELIERFDHLIMNLFYNENIYFTCCYKFRKAKSYSNEFCVGMVRNERGHLVRQKLAPAVSKE